MKQKGFTLVELVVVIVILGILAATALPKFVDFKSDAESAAINGVAGGINSSFAVNYAARAANSTKGVAVSGAAQDITAAIAGVMVGGLPNGYTVSPTSASCSGVGATVTFSVSNASFTTNKTAPATLVCTG